MDYWKVAALATWASIGIGLLFYIFLKQRWISLSMNILLGQRLHGSINQLFREIQSKAIQKNTLADVLKHVLWRFTRIGLFAIIAAMIPIVFIAIQVYLLSNQNTLLENQNKLFSFQNERIDQQTKLLDRQISLLTTQNRQNIVATSGQMVSNLINDLFEARSTSRSHIDSSWVVPDPLLIRCATVTNALSPYDTVQYYSPKRVDIYASFEKGFLLEALVDMKADFPLGNSITFTKANLILSDLSGADLRGGQFFGAYLITSNLSKADLVGAQLIGADLSGADLSSANLSYSNLSGANLSGADFSGSQLTNAFLPVADFSNAQNLTIEQLKETASLYNCRNLAPEMEQELRKVKACLFENYLGPNACEGYSPFREGS